MAIIMITGGLSGLGLELSSYYIQRNHSLFVSQNTFNRENKEAYASLKKMGTILSFPLHLESKDSLDTFWNTIQKYECPDIWINNAGILHSGLLIKYTEKHFDTMLTVNSKNTGILAHRVAKKMAQKKSGQILNIVSHQAQSGDKGLSIYSMTKAFLWGLTRELALEYGPFNISVNAIFPGWMRTGMTKNIGQKDWEKMVKTNALKRTNTMLEICKAIYDISFWKNISGQSFVLDSRII